MNSSKKDLNAQVESAETESPRREFIKKLGKFALVTPPAVTTLLSHQKANAHSTTGNGNPASH